MGEIPNFDLLYLFIHFIYYIIIIIYFFLDFAVFLIFCIYRDNYYIIRIYIYNKVNYKKSWNFKVVKGPHGP